MMSLVAVVIRRVAILLKFRSLHVHERVLIPREVYPLQEKILGMAWRLLMLHQMAITLLAIVILIN